MRELRGSRGFAGRRPDRPKTGLSSLHPAPHTKLKLSLDPGPGAEPACLQTVAGVPRMDEADIPRSLHTEPPQPLPALRALLRSELCAHRFDLPVNKFPDARSPDVSEPAQEHEQENERHDERLEDKQSH